MSYQYKRAPMTADEANRLPSACNTHEEKLIIWTLLDTSLRVAELANLKKDNRDWQGHRLMVYGKGGPYGSESKRRVIPLSSRVQPLLEGTSRSMTNSGSRTHHPAHCARDRKPRIDQPAGFPACLAAHLQQRDGRTKGDQPAGAAAASRPRPPGDDGDLSKSVTSARDQGLYRQVVILFRGCP